MIPSHSATRGLRVVVAATAVVGVLAGCSDASGEGSAEPGAEESAAGEEPTSVSPGPDAHLQVVPVSIESPVGAERATTAGLLELRNQHESTVRIEGIEPLEVDDEVEEWRLAGYWMAEGSAPIGTAAEFDPYPAEDLVDVEGLALEPVEQERGPLQVAVSLRLAEGADAAAISGFAIRYAIDGEPHEMRVDNDVTAVTPADD